MNISYKIVEVRTANGEWVFTVVMYLDDVCLGGDHHWLYRSAAEVAKRAYELGAKHGDLEVVKEIERIPAR